MKNSQYIFVLIVFICTLEASMKTNLFQFSKTVSSPESLSSEIGVIRLDSDIYRNTSDLFDDLRIFDSSETEIPFAIRTVTTTDTNSVRYSVGSKIESFTKQSNNQIATVISIDSKDSTPSELFISTPLTNFEKTVFVYGSDDKSIWYTLTENQKIFDYSQHFDMKSTSIRFEKRRFSYYKVIIDSAVQTVASAFTGITSETNNSNQTRKYTSTIQIQEPFKIDKIDLFAYSQKVLARKNLVVPYILTIDSTFNDAIKNSTSVFLSSQREPIHTVHLNVSDSNFWRLATIEGTNDTINEPHWNQIASTELYSIKSTDFRHEKLKITFDSSHRFLKYRLTITNGDNIPVTLQSISAEGDCYEILFFNREYKNLKLFYNSNQSSVPHYDVSLVLEKTPDIKGSTFTVGKQVISRMEIPSKPIVHSKHILIGSLIVMVAVLCFILFNLLGKIDPATSSDRS